MTPAKLRKLLEMSEARKSRALVELENVLAEDQRLSGEIERLSALPLDDQAHSGGTVPLSQVALRLAWVDQSVARLGKQRYDLSARIKHLRAQATEALGKHKALEKLVETAEREERAKRISRADAETFSNQLGGPEAFDRG